MACDDPQPSGSDARHAKGELPHRRASPTDGHNLRIDVPRTDRRTYEADRVVRSPIADETSSQHEWLPHMDGDYPMVIPLGETGRVAMHGDSGTGGSLGDRGTCDATLPRVSSAPRPALPSPGPSTSDRCRA